MRFYTVPDDLPYDGCGLAVAAINCDGELIDFDYTNEQWSTFDASLLRDDFPDCEVLVGTMSCWQFVVKYTIDRVVL